MEEHLSKIFQIYNRFEIHFSFSLRLSILAVSVGSARYVSYLQVRDWEELPHFILLTKRLFLMLHEKRFFNILWGRKIRFGRGCDF